MKKEKDIIIIIIIHREVTLAHPRCERPPELDRRPSCQQGCADSKYTDRRGSGRKCDAEKPPKKERRVTRTVKGSTIPKTQSKQARPSITAGLPSSSPQAPDPIHQKGFEKHRLSQRQCWGERYFRSFWFSPSDRVHIVQTHRDMASCCHVSVWSSRCDQDAWGTYHIGLLVSNGIRVRDSCLKSLEIEMEVHWSWLKLNYKVANHQSFKSKVTKANNFFPQSHLKLEEDVHGVVEFYRQPGISFFSFTSPRMPIFFSSPGRIRESVHGICLIVREWFLQILAIHFKNVGRGEKRWRARRNDFPFSWEDGRGPKKSLCGQFS